MILLGDSGVGKSSLAARYCKDTFSENHDVTIGGAYMQQVVNLPDTSQVKLHIWDTGGSERFRTMVSLYYRNAQASIVCYDLTEEESFDSVRYWTTEMQKNINTEGFVLALSGNKSDAIGGGKAKVEPELVNQFCKDNEITVHNYTSARTGNGV